MLLDLGQEQLLAAYVQPVGPWFSASAILEVLRWLSLLRITGSSV
jgi:hypothetical protein